MSKRSRAEVVHENVAAYGEVVADLTDFVAEDVRVEQAENRRGVPTRNWRWFPALSQPIGIDSIGTGLFTTANQFLITSKYTNRSSGLNSILPSGYEEMDSSFRLSSADSRSRPRS